MIGPKRRGERLKRWKFRRRPNANAIPFREVRLLPPYPLDCELDQQMKRGNPWCPFWSLNVTNDSSSGAISVRLLRSVRKQKASIRTLVSVNPHTALRMMNIDFRIENSELAVLGKMDFSINGTILIPRKKDGGTQPRIEDNINT